ncbi:hypothetical protein PROFUN_02375 [Planoprotostelium fungivorum]|uniref:Homeobox domain-containing protein n=1 Tax=Planoprotostelium fungivorum TaxID=1890364 RepID=A0A2P6NUM6_9EUKA|nr:hypothetical protein PROFUN_02375 [Planoprotostelium fungivorum]
MSIPCDSHQSLPLGGKSQKRYRQRDTHCSFRAPAVPTIHPKGRSQSANVGLAGDCQNPRNGFSHFDLSGSNEFSRLEFLFHPLRQEAYSLFSSIDHNGLIQGCQQPGTPASTSTLHSLSFFLISLHSKCLSFFKGRFLSSSSVEMLPEPTEDRPSTCDLLQRQRKNVVALLSSEALLEGSNVERDRPTPFCTYFPCAVSHKSQQRQTSQGSMSEDHYYQNPTFAGKPNMDENPPAPSSEWDHQPHHILPLPSMARPTEENYHPTESQQNQSSESQSQYDNPTASNRTSSPPDNGDYSSPTKSDSPPPVLPLVGQKRPAEEDPPSDKESIPPASGSPSHKSSSSSLSSKQEIQPSITDDSNKKRRGNLPKSATNLLKGWLFNHIFHPYPTEEEKGILSVQTGLSLNQISNWFINARRRILQPMIESARSKQMEAGGDGSLTLKNKAQQHAAQAGKGYKEPPSPPNQEPMRHSSSFPLHHAISGPYHPQMHPGFSHGMPPQQIPGLMGPMSGHGQPMSSGMSPHGMASHQLMGLHHPMANPSMPHYYGGHSSQNMSSGYPLPPSGPGGYGQHMASSRMMGGPSDHHMQPHHQPGGHHQPGPHHPSQVANMQQMPGMRDYIKTEGGLMGHGGPPSSMGNLPVAMQQTLQKVGYNMPNNDQH